MSYQEENDKLLSDFWESTFFWTWENMSEGFENFQTLELILNTKCDLKCNYCYLARHGSELYPMSLQKDKLTLANMEAVLDWLIERRMAPKLELFSGEPLTQNVGVAALNLMLKKVKEGLKIPSVTVPTNCTFILNDKKRERVEQCLEDFKAAGIPINLSASIDGKYCEGNRPFRSGVETRGDTYYDELFQFAKKWGMGFHPMIAHSRIENWRDNFLWFQKMLAKHQFSWANIYLLEVRNSDWGEKELEEFGQFIRFLVNWCFEKLDRDRGKLIEFIFQHGFNLLKAPLTTVGRGIGCSIQANVHVRLGDLAIVPCHRLSYKPFIYGWITKTDGKISGIKSHNVELALAITSLAGKSQPYCEQCLLRSLCSLGCLGSQYETTGDLFTPIPTVCKLEHQKVFSMMRAFMELGVFEAICGRVNEEKAFALRKIKEMMANE